MLKKITRKIEKEETTVVAKKCDRCKVCYDVEEDWDEAQEFHHIRFTGGYGSIFGDGTGVECDLCQKCLHAMIKDYVTTKVVW